MTNKQSTLFSRIFSNSEKIEFTGKPTQLVNSSAEVQLETNEVVSFYDFKNRRNVVFGTNFGNIVLTEELSSLGNTYTVLYDLNSPIKHLLPYRSLDERDLLYVCGEEESDSPNISTRVDMLILSLQEFFEE